MLFIIITLLVFITQTVFSYWWLIAVDAFFGAVLVGKSGLQSFFSGFAAVGLVWLGTILYINKQNEGILLGKISTMFYLSPTMLIIATVLMGAFVGGFSALSGFYLKSLWIKKKK